MPFSFRVEARDGRARTGHFATPHGTVATPAFMPVGTRATVKGLRSDELLMVLGPLSRRLGKKPAA